MREPDPTRHSLLERLKEYDNHEDWNQFVEIYWDLIYHTAIKAGLNHAEAQDVVQEAIISVCRKIRDFECDRAKGSFRVWLLQLTRWRIQDQIRKRRPDFVVSETTGELPRIASEEFPEGGEPVSELERIPDPRAENPASRWDQAFEANLLRAADQKVRKKANTRRSQAYDLVVKHGRSATEVSALFKTNRPWVYLAVYRVGKLFKAELEALNKKFP